MDHTSWLSLLLATDAPALPGVMLMRYGRMLSWIFVMGLLGAGLGWKLPWRTRRKLALVAAACAVATGPVFPVHWLGLAFQSLSFSGMLLSGLLLARVVSTPPAVACAPAAQTAGTWLVVIAVLTGYALLLDTFAVLPVQLYAWGFSPMALLCLLALCLLPGVLRGFALTASTAERWVAPCALLLFAATRLPSGNVWDALLDPWLWLVLQVLLVRRLLRNWRFKRAASPATIRG